MDRFEKFRRQLGSQDVGRPAGDPLASVRVAALNATVPANTTAPVISGVGYTGQTLTAVAGAWTGGTPTGQWYADGNAIADETGLTYDVTSDRDGSEFEYVETVGSVTAISNAIHHWVPTDNAKTLAWWDASDTSTIQRIGSNVSTWADKSSGGRDLVQTVSANQPLFDASNTVLNGSPAIVFNEASIFDTIPAFSRGHVFTLMAYKTGVEVQFSNYTMITGTPGGAFDSPRVMTAINSDTFFSTGVPDAIRFDGQSQPVTASLLPMSGNIMSLEITKDTALGVLASASTPDRGWVGPVSNVVFTASLTAAEIELYEGWMQYKIPGVSLPAGHTYTNSPPLVT